MNPMTNVARDAATIRLLKAHLRATARLVYTGKTTDANTLLRIKPLFVSFVCAHLDYMRDAFGYKLRRTTPGQKAAIFAPFRDVWLPRALREMRAEDEGKPADDVEETRYRHKRNQGLSRHGQPTGEPCVQAVLGWQLRDDTQPATATPAATPAKRQRSELAEKAALAAERRRAANVQPDCA